MAQVGNTVDDFGRAFRAWSTIEYELYPIRMPVDTGDEGGISQYICDPAGGAVEAKVAAFVKRFYMLEQF